ncbi:MAG: sulfur oxidation c-type cytochrome SoxX [Thalassobaculum sp.]|jgi:sulfur-oxidizing protein SoxX
MKTALAAGLAMLVAVSAASAQMVKPGDVTFVDNTVPQSLTGQPGDPAKGRDWVVGRKLGNCLACHANSDMVQEPYHGEVAPPLDGAGNRWSEAELRAIVINSKVAFSPETIMPAFYRDSGFNRVAKTFEGKTILTAQQVEDVVAYLMTLTKE